MWLIWHNGQSTETAWAFARTADWITWDDVGPRAAHAGCRSQLNRLDLQDRFRLVFTIEKGKQGNTLVILGIEDYH